MISYTYQLLGQLRSLEAPRAGLRAVGRLGLLRDQLIFVLLLYGLRVEQLVSLKADVVACDFADLEHLKEVE